MTTVQIMSPRCDPAVRSKNYKSAIHPIFPRRIARANLRASSMQLKKRRSRRHVPSGLGVNA